MSDTNMLPLLFDKDKIYCTMDYKQFHFHPQQRGLDPLNVLKKKKVLEKHGWISSAPMIVNRSFEILDGQHRYQAAKILGIPLFYTFQEDLPIQTVRDMAQASQGWKTGDYVSSGVRQGNDNYIRLAKLQADTGLGWESFLYALGIDRHDVAREEIREGTFVLTERAEQNVKDFLEKLTAFKQYFALGWTHRAFTAACAFLFNHPRYDHKQMMKRLEYQSTKLVKCANTSQYVALLEEIYNFRSLDYNVVNFDYSRRSSANKVYKRKNRGGQGEE